MRICLIPLRTTSRKNSENHTHLEERLAEIVPQYRPDIICLPECTLTGYLYEEEDFLRFAEAVPGPTTKQMSRLATMYEIYLCLGLLEADEGRVYNTAMLLDPNGEVLLKHRKNNEKPPFTNGDGVGSVETPLGKVGILICGDLFSDEVVGRLHPELDFLIVPMSRAFDGISPDRERWEKEEREAYIQAAKATGITTLIVNALEVGKEEPSFGGALIIDNSGMLAAESIHGTDNVLIWDFHSDVGG